MDVNTITVGGRLTKDATQKDIGQVRLTTFDIANNTGFGDKKKTNYFTVNVWGAQGDRLIKYLTKGAPVIITGEINVNNWIGNDGAQHAQLQIESKQVVLNGSAPQKDDSPTPPPFDENPNF